MSRMTSAHIAPQGGGFEPQRTNNFEIQLYGVPGQDLIVLSTASFAQAASKNQAITLGYLNDNTKVAGAASHDDASLTVRDFVDAQTYASLMAWRKLVYDPDNGNIGFASSYKKQGHVILLAPDGSVERKFKLVGVWPTEVKGGQLQMSEGGGGGVHMVTVNLSIDKIISEL